MPIQIINIGTANKGNGDPLRTAFDKVNQNFGLVESNLEIISNNINVLSNTVDSISNESSLSFDFGSILPKQVTTPIELLFYASQIDMGTITSPTPVLYDAGTLG